MTTLRIGLIGAGGIAGVHIAGWQELGAQVSIYSRSGAAGLVEKYGVAEVFSVEELLAASDMVSILTPTPSHHEYALAAIAAGKDVICEKPLAENTGRAAEIASAAAAAGVRLFPAHVVRFFPEYVAAKEALGPTGAPAALELSRSSAGPADGSWFYNESLGGGIIRDQMIHDIDQACWLAGAVVRVEAVQDPPSTGGILFRPVTARVVLTHENGAVSRLRGAWGPDTLSFSTSIRIEAPDGSALFSWPGDAADGTAVAAADGAAAGPGVGPGVGAAPAAENEPGDYLPVQDVATSPYTLQNAEFAAARSSGGPARVSPYDGVMAVALAEAAYASIASGGPVDFSAAEVQALLG